MKYDTKKSNTNINDDLEFSRNEDVSIFTVIILFFKLVFEVIKLIFWVAFLVGMIAFLVWVLWKME